MSAVAKYCLFAPRSFPNKQKSSESTAVAMNSTLGNNLSELDRLLLELNAVQHSTPAFPTEGTHTHTQCVISILALQFLSLPSCFLVPFKRMQWFFCAISTNS